MAIGILRAFRPTLIYIAAVQLCVLSKVQCEASILRILDLEANGGQGCKRQILPLQDQNSTGPRSPKAFFKQ